MRGDIQKATISCLVGSQKTDGREDYYNRILKKGHRAVQGKRLLAEGTSMYKARRMRQAAWDTQGAGRG